MPCIRACTFHDRWRMLLAVCLVPSQSLHDHSERADKDDGHCLQRVHLLLCAKGERRVCETLSRWVRVQERDHHLGCEPLICLPDPYSGL